ncbi:MAG: IS6 family transposase [Dehalococcoidia bacterium]|jgi:transposase-like protein
MNCKYCQSENTIKYGTYGDTQLYYCKDCDRKFTGLDTLPHMQIPIDRVGAAVAMYYEGLSLNEIKRVLGQIYGKEISDQGIYNWIKRFTDDAKRITSGYHPDVGYVWLADETVINVEGKQYWLMDVIDVKTRFLIASHLSSTRRVEDIQDTLKQAYAFTGRIPKVILTDHLQAYIYAIGLTFGDKTKHVQVKKFTSKPNNNIIERMQGTLRSRTKVMRDLKSLDTARMILDGFIIHYNYLRPHETLSSPHNDVTPAKKAHINFPYQNWESLIRHNEEAKIQSAGVSFFTPKLPYIKPTQRQAKRIENRVYKRRKLETRRTGIPYQPKSKGGRPRRPDVSIMVSAPLYKPRKPK